MTKTLMACAAALLLAGLAVADVTEGFRVLTTEGARRAAIAQSPRAVPDALVEHLSGERTALAQALRADGRIAIVSFIYTRCNDICSVMGSEFQQMQEAIAARKLNGQVRLLSISFDPADGPEQLSAYAKRMGARQGMWDFAGVPDPGQRRRLLDVFGITVIPAPLGEFQHNGAFHIVRPDGRLVRIVDYDAPEEALALALGEAQAKAVQPGNGA